MANFTGKWKQTKHDNMLAILKALGVAEDKRETIANNVVTVITQDGDKYVMTTEVADLKSTNTFKFGEEFEFNTLSGAKLKMCVKQEGDNKLVSADMEDIPIKFILEIKGNELVEHLDLGDVVGSRTFVRV